MQLVSYQNSYKINRNTQNNILIVDTVNDGIIMPMTTVVTIGTCNDDASNACGYYGWLLCYHWFSTTLLSEIGIDQLKDQSVLNCFEHRY
jgi:hypothetical protein